MTNTQLIRRWFEEVWNQEREATIDELCSKDAIGYGQTPDGSPIHGPENFKVFWKEFRKAFSAIHIEIHRCVEQGDLVLAQWTATMTHAGPFLGISATGKPITTTGMSLQQWKDGKIIEAWDNYDQLGLMVQLGAVDRGALGKTENPLRATG